MRLDMASGYCISILIYTYTFIRKSIGMSHAPPHFQVWSVTTIVWHLAFQMGVAVDMVT